MCCLLREAARMADAFSSRVQLGLCLAGVYCRTRSPTPTRMEAETPIVAQTVSPKKTASPTKKASPKKKGASPKKQAAAKKGGVKNCLTGSRLTVTATIGAHWYDQNAAAQ